MKCVKEVEDFPRLARENFINDDLPLGDPSLIVGGQRNYVQYVFSTTIVTFQKDYLDGKTPFFYSRCTFDSLELSEWKKTSNKCVVCLRGIVNEATFNDPYEFFE